MTKVIGIILSTIFFFGLSDELSFAVKKTAILKIHQGLPALSGFTQKMTMKKGHP
ncbi:MAG: hypothetical protein GY909_05000 [Oligoflexia bacterium]|nr:hypothetical protein [Oligoflexia bacterium]